MKALIMKYIEYLFIFLAPIAIGFAYFLVIMLLKKISKYVNYLIGLIIPLAINVVFLFMIFPTYQGDINPAFVESVSYFGLSLAGTLTYAVFAISASGIRKRTK
ncbi:MAG: hypothetical protein CVU85_02510 [Firmicutes bacterium HGW-Firmicutes-10]|jgi:hypothetical protein|nr:MAG: hypothetical protein CVU85_02510 [Firmicutes bacterium HGW-Firmicutes-10]